MFDNVSVRKEEAFKKLGFWDDKERDGVLSTAEAEARILQGRSTKNGL